MTPEQLTVQSKITQTQEFVLTERIIPAGTSYPLHWHNFIEFELITSGSARHTFNNTTDTVGPGSAYMMHYYDFHGITALTDLKLYSIHFDKNQLDQELLPYLDYNKLLCQFDPRETAHIESLILKLKKEAEDPLPFMHTVVKCLLTQIAASLIRKTTAVSDNTVPLPLQQATAYVKTHFRENLTLKQLAAQLSFSPNYLGQLFKKQIGSTFNEYLNTLRLKYACSLLTTSDLSVKEISYTAGYQSVQYFLYIFKEKMHMTPSEYRKENVSSKNILSKEASAVPQKIRDASADTLKYHSATARRNDSTNPGGASEALGFYTY